MTEPRRREAHIFERDEHDHYIEENWCSRRLFKIERFTGPILDPCAGWCRIPAAALEAGYKVIASDTVDRRPRHSREHPAHPFKQLDILALGDDPMFNWWRQANSIVTNPPFDKIEDVARRCVALMFNFRDGGDKVAMICPLRRLPAAHSWVNELGLWKIWMMSPRPSMPTGDFIKAVERRERDPKTGKLLKVGGGTQDFVWLIFKKGYSGAVVTDWLHRDG